VHDIKSLEELGVVSVSVATTEFAVAAEAQSQALGYDPAVVLVAHPIQDRTNTELRTLADGAFDEIVAALTSMAGKLKVDL
jgi:hypothetical protein